MTFIAAIGGAAYLEAARGQRATFERRAESIGSIRVQMYPDPALPIAPRPGSGSESIGVSLTHFAEAEYLLAGDGSVRIANGACNATRVTGGGPLDRQTIIQTLLLNKQLLVEMERYAAIRAGKNLLPERETGCEWAVAARHVVRQARFIRNVWVLQFGLIAAAAMLTIVWSSLWAFWLTLLTMSFLATRLVLRGRHRASEPLPVAYTGLSNVRDEDRTVRGS